MAKRTRRPHLTEAELAKAKEMYLSGTPLAEIASALGCCKGTILVRRRLEGWEYQRQRWTAERKTRAVNLYLSGLTVRAVATELGTNRGHIRRALAEGGVEVRAVAPPSGPDNHMWKGGRTTDKSGYVLIRVVDHPDANSNGYVREHRLVMSRVLGRRLLPEEVVHHLNGIRGDNRPENLELFATNADHLRHELKGRCPNWTEDGRRRLREAADRRRKP